MDERERQILLDTFLAKIKYSAAFSRGDRVQMENYNRAVLRLTSGEDGYLSAAVAGETLAIRVLEQVADYCIDKGRINFAMASLEGPGNPGRALANNLGEILDRELSPTLGQVSEPVRVTIQNEIWEIATDILRGKQGNAAKLWESVAQEQRRARPSRFITKYAASLGEFIGALLKGFIGK